MVNLSI